MLDSAGWVGVDELLRAFSQKHDPMSRGELEDIVRGNDKARFAFSDDGKRIRALQGHSLDVELEYEPREPPDLLFHGTVASRLASIRERGLERGRRHDVHLSTSAEVAEGVGERRGRPVVLEVDAARMADAGHAFRCTPNGVWLTEHVPAVFIRFPD